MQIVNILNAIEYIYLKACIPSEIYFKYFEAVF